MNKVLIISYFFPPCTLTAAQRPYGWLKYLPQFGYKPIVITRNWDIDLSKPEDQLRDAGDQLFIEKTETHEVHYLPYKASFRDRLFNSKNPSFKKCSKIFTFINSIGENFSNQFIPFGDFYEYAESLIQKHTFTSIIITGNPFVQFRFGNLLTNKYNIPWIADYRDDWTTSEIIKPKGIVAKLIHHIQIISEKKWVGSAKAITSVSPVYTERISNFVNIPGVTILNGFDEFKRPINSNQKLSVFSITYNGTLYNTQDLEGFIEVILLCIDKYKNRIDFCVNFPGVAYDSNQLERIQKLIVGYESYFFITSRIAKEKVIEIQSKSDLLLMLPHINIKGIPSSKLFEYLTFKKPVICFPSDHDIIEEILLDTGIGIILNDKNELFEFISNYIDKKLNNHFFFFEKEIEKIDKYSVKTQTEKLALLLNNN